MLTNTKEKQIEWILTHPDDKVTISGLSVASGTAYPQTYNNVQDLVQERIFVTENIGSAKIVTINPDAPIDVLLSIEAKRKQQFLEKYTWAKLMIDDLLRYTGEYFFILTVFGSYAKGKETLKSDLDLLVIVPAQDYISLFETALSKVYTKTKKDITVVTKDEFVEMIKNNKFNVGTEAKKYHLLLYGAEQWYNIVKKV